MAINAKSEIFIEPDNEYTFVTTSIDDAVGGKTLVANGSNLTGGNAFTSARDSILGLAVGGKKIVYAQITVRIE